MFTFICIFQAKGDEQLWCPRVQRKVIYAIVDEWLVLNSNKTTVKKLLSALGLPDWMNVKLRVETLLLENVNYSYEKSGEETSRKGREAWSPSSWYRGILVILVPQVNTKGWLKQKLYIPQFLTIYNLYKHLK